MCMIFKKKLSCVLSLLTFVMLRVNYRTKLVTIFIVCSLCVVIYTCIYQVDVLVLGTVNKLCFLDSQTEYKIVIIRSDHRWY